MSGGGESGKAIHRDHLGSELIHCSGSNRNWKKVFRFVAALMRRTWVWPLETASPEFDQGPPGAGAERSSHRVPNVVWKIMRNESEVKWRISRLGAWAVGSLFSTG